MEEEGDVVWVWMRDALVGERQYGGRRRVRWRVRGWRMCGLSSAMREEATMTYGPPGARAGLTGQETRPRYVCQACGRECERVVSVYVLQANRIPRSRYVCEACDAAWLRGQGQTSEASQMAGLPLFAEAAGWR